MLEAGISNHFKMTSTVVRQFAVLCFAMLLVLAFGNYQKHGGELTVPAIFVGLAVLVGSVGVLSPSTLSPFLRILMAVVTPIGSLFSKLVLGGLFYGFVTPFALLLRLSGRDPLRLKRSKDAPSYWVSGEEKKGIEFYFHQY